MNTNLKSEISNLKHWSFNLQLPKRGFPPIALILAAFVVLGTAYDVATPLFEKPDEIWHYPYVKYLADGQRFAGARPGPSPACDETGDHPAPSLLCHGGSGHFLDRR